MSTLLGLEFYNIALKCLVTNKRKGFTNSFFYMFSFYFTKETIIVVESMKINCNCCTFTNSTNPKDILNFKFSTSIFEKVAVT